MVVATENLERSGLMSGSDQAYVVGQIQPALEEITISEFFARTVSRYPDREACIFCSLGSAGLGPNYLKRSINLRPDFSLWECIKVTALEFGLLINLNGCWLNSLLHGLVQFWSILIQRIGAQN